MPFREAHHLVGQAVKLTEGRPGAAAGLEALDLETLRGLSTVFEADVAEVWDFRAAVERRAALGGTSPASVRAQIAQARARLAAE